MLPTTGYFHGIACPFYENGSCDRPYCHYRHVKRDFHNISNEDIESEVNLQKLVSAAVQKALRERNASGSAVSSQLSLAGAFQDNTKPISVQSTNKATYNPTPISELNKIISTCAENTEEIEQRKRHIPVPYTPRKPASIPIRRPIDTNGSSKPFIYIPPPATYTPGSGENVQNDKYTPTGTVESKEKYLPGTEKELQEYSPDPATQDTSNKRNYVPSSDKQVNKKKILEYKPAKISVKTDKPHVTYQPTPRSLAPCFSSDEDEPEPKKRKISTDLNEFDDLGPEFDILDQILHEEKPDEEPRVDTKSEVKKDNEHKSSNSKHSNATTEIKQKNGDATKTEKSKSEKSHKSHHKKSDKKEKVSSEDKGKTSDSKHKKEKTSSEDNDIKKSTDSKHRKSSSEDRHKKDTIVKDKSKEESKYSDKKSSRKESSKDKEKKHSKDKHSSDRKKHSSKSSHHSPKRSKDSSPKKEKHSDSKRKSERSVSRSSKGDSKSKDRSHKSSKHDRDRRKSKELSKDNVSDDNHFSAEENGHVDSQFESSEEDEDTIASQCRKIFEEYIPTVKPKNVEEEIRTEDPTEEYVPSKKRISRTTDSNIKVISKAPVKPDFKVSAAKAMAERLAKVREFHSLKQSTTPVNDNSSSKVDLSKNAPSATSSSKIRIAHVPYASTLLNAKKTITPALPPKNSLPSTSSTISQTVKKGVQRVAHIPSEKFIDRPGVLEPLVSKIPANIRSTYLNMMIDECLKLYISSTDAYCRAQHEELNTSKKCSTVQIYKNSAVLTVSRLRKELQESNGVKKSGSACAVLGKDNNSNNSGSWSIESKSKKFYDNPKEFVGAKFYSNVQKWILTEEQLKENGFPRPHSSGEKGRAIIYGQNKHRPPKGFLRTCCRCKKDYTVDKKGFPTVKEECIYHPNNKYRVRGEARYQCCSQDATSDGCCVAPSHVYEYVDYENLKGYVKTLPPDRVTDDYGVYALDCEMCYTTQGLDLTRVTVINSSCKVVYETLIKPLHPIIDYNTRYSGITEEHMTAVRTTLLDVQATLLTMFSSKTILVGHSLESDFKALKLIHDTVIDTSVLFPHKMGPPYKRALRNLTSEHLKKIIQNSVDGHDSAEDAMVCMELLQYKLREDLKTR